MKKCLSLILSIVMVFSVFGGSIPYIFAEDGTPQQSQPEAALANEGRSAAEPDSADNGLYAYPLDINGNRVDGDPKTAIIMVGLGETCTLHVDAGADNGELQYYWSESISNGPASSTQIFFEELYGDSYTTEQITKRRGYTCKVADEYGNVAYVYFSVSVENGFSAELEPQYIVADEDGTATVRVSASCDTGELTYEWYRDDYEYHMISTGSNSPELSVGGVNTANKFYRYTCQVYDTYINSANLHVRIYRNGAVDPNVYAEALDGADTVNAVYGDDGFSAHMSVSVRSDTGIRNCKWYSSDGTELYCYQFEEDNIPKSIGYDATGLTGGERFYCVLENWFGNTSEPVWFTVTTDQLEAYPEREPYYVYSGGSEWLQVVNVTGYSGDLSFQWYYPNGDPIPGEVSSAYYIDSITEEGIYTCRVTDSAGRIKDVFFTVVFKIPYYLSTDNYSFAVSPGETALISVTAYTEGEVYNDDSITYQWYIKIADTGSEEDWEEIQGATGSSYTTDPISHKTIYKCIARDGYDSAVESSWITVSVENPFSVYPVNGQNDFQVTYGEPVSLELAVDGTDPDSLTYEWFRRENVLHEEDGESWISYEWVMIDSSNGRICTIQSITEYQWIKVVVTDEYGNSYESNFYVHVDNGFVVHPLIPSRFIVSSGGSVAIIVDASCNDNDLSYEWFVRRLIQVEDESGTWDDWVDSSPEGVVGSELTVENITGKVEGRVTVSDKYGNSAERYFYIDLNTEYINTDIHLYPGVDTELSVAPGDSVYLYTNYDSDWEIYYQWYEKSGDEWQTIPEATAYNYEFTALESTQYRCVATNEYGITDDVVFTISLRSNLEAWAEGDWEKWAEPCGSVEMTVCATIDGNEVSDGQVTYQWRDENGVIEGATGRSYTANSINYLTRYYCDVTDQYGYTVTVEFRARVNSPIYPYAIGGEQKYVPKGESVELSVGINENEPGDADGVRYEWYRPVKRWVESWEEDFEGNLVDNGCYETYAEIDENATGSTYTVYDVTESISADYLYCIVYDKYGNDNRVNFWVYIDNNLQVSAEQTAWVIESGSSVTMTVDASCDEGGLNYWWGGSELVTYVDEYGNTNEWWEGIDFGEEVDRTGTAFTADGITEQRQYSCTVSDQYGGNKTVYFNIYIGTEEDTELTVSPASETERFACYGEYIGIGVNAYCKLGSTYYKWFIKENDEWVSLNSEWGNWYYYNATGPAQYKCVVTNDFGKSAEIEFTVKLRTNLEAYPGSWDSWESDKWTEYGGSATMTVQAQIDGQEVSDGDVSYQWRDENGIIEGATGRSYTAENIVYLTKYYCDVTDQFGYTVTVEFVAHVNNECWAEHPNDTNEYYVSPGETATVSIIAHVNGEVTYQWSKYYSGMLLNNETGEEEWFDGYIDISGANEAAYISEPAYSYARYRCTVTDSYGNTCNPEVYVYIDNGLYAEAMPRGFIVSPGSDVTLTVNAGCNQGPLSIEWNGSAYIQDEYGNGNWDTILSNYSGLIYTAENVTERRNYSVTISDQYGSLKTIDFHIYLESDGIDPSDVRAWADSDTEMSVNYGDWRTLSVGTDGYHEFQWYDADHNPIEKAINYFFKTPSIEQDTRYYCVVTNEFGYTKEVEFILHMTIDSWINAWSDIAYPLVQLNGSVTLTVDHVDASNPPVYYQWLYADGTEIPGATGQSYTVENVTSRSEYYCRVYDDYGTWQNVGFTVCVDNGLDFYPINWQSEYTLTSSSDTVHLEVVVSAYETDGITYSWYYRAKELDEYGMEYYPSHQLENTECYLDISGLTELTTYSCIITDKYLNIGQVDFNVYPYSPIHAKESNVYVGYGQQAILEVVNDTPEPGMNYYYRWIDRYGMEISGETGPTCTTETVYEWFQYRCIVSDDQGEITTVWFNVSFVNSWINAWSDNSDPYVQPNDSVTLTVDHIDSDYQVSYQWYYADDTEISGETNNTYFIDDISKLNSFQFYCRVYDNYGAQQFVYFNVHVSNNLWIENSGYNYRVSPNGSVTLDKHIVNADDKTGITYQWYEQNASGEYEEIPGAISQYYTVNNILGQRTFKIVVTDRFGNHAEGWAYIVIENHLKVTASNPAVLVEPGQDIQLEVTATFDQGNITYTWTDESGNDYPVTGNVFAINSVQSSNVYFCNVSDDYGNSNTLRFVVKVNTGLKAKAVNGVTEYRVAPGGSAVLSVEATADDPSSISYQWAKWGDEISGETSATFNTGALYESRNYNCYVHDANGNCEVVNFYVGVDNQLIASAEKETLFVIPGGSVTLKVNADAAVGGLTYTWYRYVGDDAVEIENASSSTLLVKDVRSYQRYYCVVSDEYYNYRSVRFYIRTNSGLNAYPENGKSTVYVLPNEQFSLAVFAEADSGSIHYQWYRNSEKLSNETDRVLKNRQEYDWAEYKCRVSDDFGYYIDVVIEADAYNGMHQGSFGETYIVDEGDSLTIETNFSVVYGSLSYQWYELTQNNESYIYDEKALDGETGPNLYLPNVTSDGHYLLRLSDEYGHTVGVDYYVRMQSSVGNNIRVKGLESSGYEYKPSWTVYNISATLGEAVEIELEGAPSDAEFFWYSYSDEWGALSGDGPVFTTPPLSRAMYLQASVAFTRSDGSTEERDFQFEIGVDTGLNADRADSMPQDGHITVAPGASATMSVDASSDHGTLTYNWFKWIPYDEGGDGGYDTQIYGEYGSTYTMNNISERCNVYCRVMDDYYCSKYVYFYIDVDNDFSAGAENDKTDFGVVPGREVILNIDADCQEGDLHYYWNGSQYEGKSYFVVSSATEDNYIYCVVIDEFGNRKAVTFSIDPASVTVQNSGNSEIAADISSSDAVLAQAVLPSDIVSKDDVEDITINLELNDIEPTSAEDALITEALSEKYPDEENVQDIQYVSIDLSYTVGNESAAVEETTEPIEIVLDVPQELIDQGHRIVAVRIHDGEAEIIESTFDRESGKLTIVSDRFSTYALAAIKDVLPDESQIIDLIESVKVYFTIPVGEENAVWVRFTASTEGDYVITPMSGGYSAGSVFYDNDMDIIVEDRLGCEVHLIPGESVYGKIWSKELDPIGYHGLWVINTSHEIEPAPIDGVDWVETEPGEEVTIGVIEETGYVSYQWYRVNRGYSSIGYTMSTELLDGQNNSTLVFNNEKTAGYTCVVTDNDGNKGYVLFDVNVNNELSVSDSGGNEFGVVSILAENGCAELSVKASAKEGPLSYYWYKVNDIYGDNPQDVYLPEYEGVTVLSLSSVKEYEYYYCTVMDKYGNRAVVSFNISPDSGVRAAAKNGITTLRVQRGDTARMQVEITAPEGSVYSIYWEEYVLNSWDYYDYQRIDGAYTDTWDSDLVYGEKKYRCHVVDQYGYDRIVEFNVGPELPTYTVTWYVDGQDPIEEVYEEGSVPVYPGGVPFKAADEMCIYTFYAWDDGNTNLYSANDPLPEVTGPVTYYAVFNSVNNNSSLYGSITSFTDRSGIDTDVTVELLAEGNETPYVPTITGNKGYSFENVPTGEYTLRVSKAHHATREYSVSIGTEPNKLDVKIHLMGDINGDGKISMNDVARVNGYLKGTMELNDYQMLCADVHPDSVGVTAVDFAMINSHARRYSYLW